MLSRVPFVGLVLTFAAGIWLGDWLNDYPLQGDLFNYSLQTAVILGIAAVCFWCYQNKKNKAFGVLLSIILFLSGVLSITLKHDNLNSDRQKLIQNPCDFYLAAVQNIPEKRAKTFRTDAIIEKVRVRGQWIGVHVRAYLSIPQEAAKIPSAGDRLLVKGIPDIPRPPLNPGEFDYRRYLWNKGVVWTDYLPENTFRIIGSPESQSVNLWAQKISQWSDRQFHEHLADAKSYGLVKAMLLGRRDDLRTDQIDDYTTSGTVHILSVSGMHVAIIFLVLGYLLGWLKRLKGGKYIYLSVLTILLGLYAVITGLPPSVQRATLMCIIFIVAEVFSRRHNAMNTLALSALIILLMDPQALFDVGFQLSYLAMTGIFLFYKPVEAIWQPSSRLWKYIWQITALSLAAQLVTLPLSLYYFHQFPFYFWLVNPFVITFTNALLPGALLLLFVCLGPFVWLKTVIGWLVNLFASLTNISVAVPKVLPGYLIGNLYLDKQEVILLYAVFMLAWYAYESREYDWIKYAFVVVLLFVFYSTSQSFQTYILQKGIIHAVPKHTVLSFKEGDRLYIFSDKTFPQDTNAYGFYLKNYGISQGILKTIFITEPDQPKPRSLYVKRIQEGTLFSWQGKTIFQGSYLPISADLDYCLLTPAKYPKNIHLGLGTKTTYLISSGVKKRTADLWQQLLKDSHAPFHDLQSQGALLLP